MPACTGNIGQQSGQQPLQPFAPGLIQSAHECRPPQFQQQPRSLFRRRKPRPRQRVRQNRRFDLRLPESPQVDLHRRIRFLSAEDDQAEMAAHACPVIIQLTQHSLPIRLPHRASNSFL